MATRVSRGGRRGVERRAKGDAGFGRTPTHFESKPIVDDEFLDLAEERIGAIERAAELARDDLTSELADLGGDQRVRRADARELQAAATELEREIDRLLAIAGEMRVTLARLTDGEPDGSPSAGVRLMINQMALLGRSEASISRALADLGVEDPDALVHEVLGGKPPAG